MKYRRGLTRVFLVLWAFWVFVVLIGYPWYMKGEYSRQYVYWLGAGEKALAAAYLKDLQALTYTSWFKALLQYWPYTLVALVGVPVVVYGLLHGIALTVGWLMHGFRGDSAAEIRAAGDSRSTNTWIKACAGGALLIIAASVAYYFVIYLPRERTARLQMEEQEGVARERRERERVELQRQAEQTERAKLELSQSHFSLKL